MGRAASEPTAQRRCESCGRFVSRRHLKTARYYYAIDSAKPVSVYSLATASVFQERLDCADCSMDCCRMREAQQGYGMAIGANGLIRCAPESTQENIVPLDKVEPE